MAATRLPVGGRIGGRNPSLKSAITPAQILSAVGAGPWPAPWPPWCGSGILLGPWCGILLGPRCGILLGPRCGILLGPWCGSGILLGLGVEFCLALGVEMDVCLVPGQGPLGVEMDVCLVPCVFHTTPLVALLLPPDMHGSLDTEGSEESFLLFFSIFFLY